MTVTKIDSNTVEFSEVKTIITRLKKEQLTDEISRLKENLAKLEEAEILLK